MIFYNSSLPRCGSTIFQNIIGQNQDFYVTPTSGLLELIFAARSNYTNSPEFKAQDAEQMKTAFLSFCKGGMESYFASLTDKKYVMDKSRGWFIHYDFLNQIFPNPKIVCVVRDLRDIIASMEKIYRKNQHLHSDIINHGELKGTTCEKRVKIWLNKVPIGLALDRLMDAIQQGITRNIHFVKYEDLLTKPEQTMKYVYRYFGIEEYQHDFTNIPQITVEDDTIYGMFGDHTIRTSLEPLKQEHEQVLGKAISDNIKASFKWYFDYFKY